MTQIQGRIKTVVDYSEQNSALGVCCKPDGTKESQLKSLNECNQLGGKWVASSNIDSVVCPQPGERGCCCSCSYTTKNTGTDSDWTHPDHYNIIPIGRLGSPNGLRGDISKCECEYLNGNWSAGSCPEGDSIESAIMSLDGREYFIPLVPMEIPSLIPIVLNINGTASSLLILFLISIES